MEYPFISELNRLNEEKIRLKVAECARNVQLNKKKIDQNKWDRMQKK